MESQLSMESKPQNPEFRNNPENDTPVICPYLDSFFQDGSFFLQSLIFSFKVSYLVVKVTNLLIKVSLML